uniref:Uncharacterized protein n=1 Tax=Rhizophora mucronata TaxID=61149 RepID=A0A2P2NIQ6_RHIMU
MYRNMFSFWFLVFYSNFSLAFSIKLALLEITLK